MSCQPLLICHHDQLLLFPSLLGQRFKNLLYNNDRAVDKALQLAALQLQDTLWRYKHLMFKGSLMKEQHDTVRKNLSADLIQEVTSLLGGPQKLQTH